MAKMGGNSGLVKVGTAYGAPGAQGGKNGSMSSAAKGGGKMAPQVRVGNNKLSRKGGSKRGR